jgi:rhamnogalacturonan endolyase
MDNDSAASDYRPSNGWIWSGPEYLTVFSGRTGANLATVAYVPARGTNASDGLEGDRWNLFLAAVAYLDGQKPSLIMARGYFTRTYLVAWNWREGQLTRAWELDSNGPGGRGCTGQGNHNIGVGDIDGDGRQEIVHGGCAIDDDGTVMYGTGLGHGDAGHLAVMHPDHQADRRLHWFQAHDAAVAAGLELRIAGAGALVWGQANTDSVGPSRAMAADISAANPGYELWGVGGGIAGVFNLAGEPLDVVAASCNFAVWWNGDLLRELADNTAITGGASCSDCAPCNGDRATPVLSADLFGDWREEIVWRLRDNSGVRICTTDVPTPHRIFTLMHDLQYRVSVAWQNVGYNLPPQVGFYLGAETALPVVHPGIRVR